MALSILMELCDKVINIGNSDPNYLFSVIYKDITLHIYDHGGPRISVISYKNFTYTTYDESVEHVDKKRLDYINETIIQGHFPWKTF